MSFGANCLVAKLNSVIVGLQTNTTVGFNTSIDFARISGGLNSLDTSMLSVDNENNLPDACDNTGRFVYIKCEGTFRYSDGFSWTRDTNSTSYTKIWSWGRNDAGQLLVSDTLPRSSPTSIVCNDGSWCKIAEHSGKHTVALKTDGTLWGWGCTVWGELGSGNCDGPGVTLSPIHPVGARCNWSKIATGTIFTGAIKTDGTLWTWGGGCFGKLGNGVTSCRCSPGTTSGGGTSWADIVGNYHHVMAIKTDGTLWSWGQNNSGQLGDGTTVDKCSPGTIVGDILCSWFELSMGSYQSAGIKCDGTLWTWGRNSKGQLGNGTTVDRSSPGTVAGGGTNWFRVFAASSGVTMAVKCDGTLWTWGGNRLGVLGDGTTVSRCSPGTVIGLGSNWCNVSSLFEASAGIKCDGTIWTWGEGENGQLGDGNAAVARCSPGTTAGCGTNWCQISAGSNHVAAIKTDGTIWTWGYGICGPLGDGTTVNRCSPGTIIGNDNTWCKVFSGDYRTAGIKCDGTLWTWGRNNVGQLGDGTTVSRSSPGTVAGGGTTWCQVSLSLWPGDFSSAIKTDGTLWTWGRNNTDGKLGDGTTVNRCSPGTVAGGGTTWCEVSLGTRHSASIKKDGTLWTWGYNAGYLGTGTTINRCSPGTIAGTSIGTIWNKIDIGMCHSAAIKTDGTLWTWGLNSAGQLGDGTSVDRCSPGTVAGGGTTWCQVSSGFCHTAAIKTDGTLWTWGCNQCGNLGINDFVTNRFSPGTVVGGGTTWCKVSSGRAHVAAIKTDGTIWSWGANYTGTVGDCTRTARACPINIMPGTTNWTDIVTSFCSTFAFRTRGF